MAAYRSCNMSEIQLYKVLHKANLLKYFETFIAQGGDDVQQLCEAGEDEFLEIMALVGMANKPLHVRRLQKALQEWVTSPSTFEEVKTYPAHVITTTDSSPQKVSPSHSMERSTNIQDYKVTAPQSSTITTSTPWRSQTRETTFSDGSNMDDPNSSDSQQGEFKDISIDSLYNQPDQLYSSFMDMPQPALLEHQIDAITSAATMLAQEMHHVEPKSMPKKPISQEITSVMQMSTNDPNRMKALRKYAAIYGRFDSKRKNARPMSLHEISVNEAAAQLCSHFPALLTRREELFPLARQVVRDSGYQYSKGHSRPMDFPRNTICSTIPPSCSGSATTSDPSKSLAATVAGQSFRAAEILVQPKLELGETMSPPPTILPSKHEDSLSHLQSELIQITLELTDLTKEQDRIRSVLRKLLEGNDHSQMKKLTAQMDILNDRQTAMVRKRQKIEDTIVRYRKSGLNCSTPTGCVSEPAVTEPASNTVHLANFANSQGRYYGSSCCGYNNELLTSNPLNTLYMAALQNHKDSLFQEGLRIAMQYGMSDFAKELIGMKFTRDNIESEKDSGFSTSSECSPGFLSNSSSSPFSALPSRAVNSLSSPSYSVSESGKCVHSLPSSSSSSPAVLSDPEFGHFQRPSGHFSLSEAEKIIPTHSSDYQIESNKHVATGHPSDVLHSSTDGHTDQIYPVGKSISGSSNQNMSIATNSSMLAQSCITPSIATTTITTNSVNVMEAGTRRSSRRKNGYPDYDFPNGGKKHPQRNCKTELQHIQ